MNKNLEAGHAQAFLVAPPRNLSAALDAKKALFDAKKALFDAKKALFEIIEAINFNWEALGAMLANMSDQEQKPFFTAFAREMNKYPSQYHRDMQLSYISGKFTKEESEVFAFLGEREGE